MKANKPLSNKPQSSATYEGAAGHHPAAATPARSLTTTDSSFVKLWAAMGLCWLLLSAYIWGSWILSPEFAPTPRGADPVPGWLVIWTHTFEFLSTSLWCACIYFWAYKPWRKTGSFTWDGLFILAGVTLYIQDPWINYTNYWFMYSSVFTNFGSWTTHTPGWLVPRGNLIPEAPLAWGGAYTWLVLAPAIFAGGVINRVKARWPQMGIATIFVAFFVFFAFLDLVLEGTFAFTSLYGFASTIPEWTLFAGKPYQFPLYETIWMGSMWSAYTWFRYFRDDKGLSVVERGVDKLKLSARGKTFVRWLALVGAVQAILLLTYNVPIQFFAMNGSAFPHYPSYMVNNVCGPKTPYDCPSAATPIPRVSNPTNRVVPVTGVP